MSTAGAQTSVCGVCAALSTVRRSGGCCALPECAAHLRSAQKGNDPGGDRTPCLAVDERTRYRLRHSVCGTWKSTKLKPFDSECKAQCTSAATTGWTKQTTARLLVGCAKSCVASLGAYWRATRPRGRRRRGGPISKPGEVFFLKLLHDAAATSFPITGAAPRQSVCVLKLQQQRRALSQLIKLSSAIIASARGSNCIARNEKWRQQMSRCQQQHPSLQWEICAWSNGDTRAWISETRVLLNRTRSAIRKEQQRMSRAPPVPLSECSAAHVHRMLKSDALPSHLQSVVNARGQLTSSAEELESVMVDHFSNVFAMPAPDPTPLPHPPPAMLFDKSSVRAEWFDSLMAPVARKEIREALADTKFISSPGEDGVSTGLWKLALEGSDILCSPALQSFSTVVHSVQRSSHSCASLHMRSTHGLPRYTATRDACCTISGSRRRRLADVPSASAA